METTILKVTGMSCGMCVQHVTNALQNIEGVQGVNVDLDSGLATVQHNSDLQVEPLIAAIEEESYNAQATESAVS